MTTDLFMLIGLALAAMLYIEIGTRLTRRAVGAMTGRIAGSLRVLAVVAWPLMLTYGMVRLGRKDRTK
jgi:hypothetical protein